jgi:hypothetical protein
MSSIHTLNKNTDSKKGSGLPFYDKLDYIFSKSNVDFNDTLGLWYTPNEKIPTFQLFQSFPTLVSLAYKFTKGDNNFVPANDIFFIPLTHLSLTPVVVNGIQEYIISSLESVPIGPVPNGRWIIEIVVTNGIETKTFYSEEFLTKPCC